MAETENAKPAVRVRERTAQAGQAQRNAITILLQLETNARRAQDEAALFYTAVNETRKLINYRQCVFWSATKNRIMAVSGAAEVDSQSPYVRWAKALAKEVFSKNGSKTGRIGHEGWSEFVSGSWGEWVPEFGFWLPLMHKQECLGALILFRNNEFTDNELTLGAHLGETYAHAWRALGAGRGRLAEAGSKKRNWVIGAVAAAVLAAMFFPIRMSALGEAEVVAEDLTVLRAPFDGSVGEILVDPNESVKKGQLLARLDVRDVSDRLGMAEKARDVEEIRTRQLEQKALTDRSVSSEVALARATLAEKTAEVSYLRDMLGRADITSPIDGVAVFTDKNELLGTPVRMGSRILDVAGPYQTKLVVWLSAQDGMTLPDETEVRLFLNTDPDRAIEARLKRASYVAVSRPEGYMAYRLDAEFNDPDLEERPRVGLRGVAKVYGERAPLGYYLLRRPYTAVRQYLGL